MKEEDEDAGESGEDDDDSEAMVELVCCCFLVVVVGCEVLLWGQCYVRLGLLAVLVRVRGRCEDGNERERKLNKKKYYCAPFYIVLRHH